MDRGTSTSLGNQRIMKLTSPAFTHDGTVPVRYTCDGDELSPPLEWTDLPARTKALVLIVDDPDAPDPKAPRKVWVHWIAYNIPSAWNGFAEGAGNKHPVGPVRYALTDSTEVGYHGPCPPVGRHRYFFRLFALDEPLQDLGPTARRREVESAMAGHVLGTAELMAAYER